jgi:hypothetical protein
MGSSEEIYWNMAKNNRKLDAKMPSGGHFGGGGMGFGGGFPPQTPDA